MHTIQPSPTYGRYACGTWSVVCAATGIRCGVVCSVPLYPSPARRRRRCRTVALIFSCRHSVVVVAANERRSPLRPSCKYYYYCDYFRYPYCISHSLAFVLPGIVNMRESNVRICEYEMNVRCEANGAILYYCIRADEVGTSGVVSRMGGWVL